MSAPSDAKPAKSLWRIIALVIVVGISLVVASRTALQDPGILGPRALQLIAPWPLPAVVAIAWVVVRAAMSGLGSGTMRLRRLLLFAFGLRVILGLLHHEASFPTGFQQYRDGLTGFDAFLYTDLGLQLSAQGLVGEGIWSALNYQGIAYYYGILFFVFGPNPAVGVVFNCVLAAITPVLLYRFLLLVTRERIAEGAALALAVLPESLLWSSLLMKESLITFVFVAGLLAATVASRTRNPWAILTAVVCAWLLVQLRIAAALILIVSLVIATVIWYRRHLVRLAMYGTLSLVLFAIVAAFSSNTLINNLGSPLSPAFYRGYADIFRSRPADLNAANLGSSLGVMTSGALTEGKVYWVPVRSAMFYLNPTPWTRGLGVWWDSFKMSSAALVWICIPAALIGLLQLLKAPSPSAPLWVCWLFGTVLISSSTPFIDDRLRMMMMPFYLGVAAVGFSSLRQWWPIYALAPPVAVIAGFLFYLYKSGA